MKRLLCILFLLTCSLNSFAFVALGCGNESIFENDSDELKNRVLLVKEDVTPIHCERLGNGNGYVPDYDVEITGIGLGLRGALAGEALTIICPTVRKEALGVETFVNKKGKLKKGTTTFYGIKASAIALLGVDGAVFANGKGGFCVLVGVTALGLGASVTGAKMTIKN